MNAHPPTPPVYAPNDTSWPALLHFANEVAFAYRRKNEQLRGVIADLHRQIEIYRKLVADFERQREAGA